MPEPLLIGTKNPGKAIELARLLEGLPWEVKSLADFPEAPPPEEDGATFAENAVKKASYFSARFGLTCVADDSGLVVDALGGAPGVYSARYAGQNANDKANAAKLLAALSDTPEGKRTARFVCCVAFARPGSETHIETGTVEGAIAFAPRGTGGFGYDPVFVPSGYAQTFGEMPSAEKMLISHRGNALRKLRVWLEERTT